MYKHNYWEVKVTHVPTGIEVVRTSDHFRHQHLAREAALRYLKSILASKGLMAYHKNFINDIRSGTVIEEIV